VPLARAVVAGIVALVLTVPPAAADVARVVDEQTVGPRTLDLTISSPALGTTANVRLLLPPDWTRRPRRRWPVLYLLHGALEPVGYRSWTEFTDVEALTSGTNVLVVMPDAGLVGWYSDWWNDGRGGPPRWETFHLRELRRILQRRYRAGRARAVAGLSMGGLGATSYAARHPGMFRAVASYSGALHSLAYPWVARGSLAVTGFDPDALWGDPAAQRQIWEAHDPYALARRLVRLPVFISAGNGDPGPLDPPGAAVDEIEPLVQDVNEDFASRLRELGGRVTTDFYGAGGHRWPYWERELHRSFEMLMSAVDAKPAD
jgi:diacylglycerol O-acyltransferase / trehalose O-mycolyltransferase / mycolyltransferase Ag85